MLVDFHMHSTYSDGRLTVTELIKMAKEKNLGAISLTDHDEVGGVRDVLAKGDIGIGFVPGIEFSTTLHGKDVHVLAYRYDPENKGLLEYTAFFKEERRTRVIKMLQKCTDCGYEVTFEELRRQFPGDGSLGRPHVAQLLMAKGYVGSVGEAFKTLISHNGPCYVPKYEVHPAEVLSLIRRAGGLAVLAHPLLIRNDDYVEEVLDLGLDGIEVYHPRHSEEDKARYLAMAQKRGLLVSGGSDFHAIKGRYPEQLGEFEVTDDQTREFVKAVNPWK